MCGYVCPFEERYKTEMNKIFDEQNKYNLWMDVEIALAKAHWKMGDIKKSDYDAIKDAKKKVKIERIKEIEAKIHHDLMAMVKALSEKAGKSGAYVHMGATSYDIEDTATAVMLKDGLMLIRKRMVEFAQLLRRMADKYKSTPCIGRTHGQHAIPTTLGMKFALYYSDTIRNINRVDRAIDIISVGKMSGAIGTKHAFGKKSDEIERIVMNEMGIRPAKITTQVVQRDRHAEVVWALAVIAASLEKIAKEIRNLQRTEIGEVMEPFGASQVGSSAMPHKSNPHKSERVCSLAKLIRSFVNVAIENIALEHERDLTNSANERVVFSHTFIGVDYMLKQMIMILSGLRVFEDRMMENINKTHGLIFAENVMAALVDKGMPRQEAHELLRKWSIEAKEKRMHLKDIVIKSGMLNDKNVDELFSYDKYVKSAERVVSSAIKMKIPERK